MTERIEELIYEIAAERSDRIRVEYGYDEDLQDAIEDVLASLDGDVKERVRALIDRMESARLDDNVKIYRGAFRDGLKYAFEIAGRFPVESIKG